MPDSKRALTPQQELTVVAELLHEMAHLTVSTAGIELIGCVIDGPRDVGTLAQMTDTGISSVSKKLADLRHAGILRYHLEGNRHIYQLADSVQVVPWDDTIAVVARVPGGMLAVGVSREILDRVRRDAGPPALHVEVRADAAQVRIAAAPVSPPPELDPTEPM